MSIFFYIKEYTYQCDGSDKNSSCMFENNFERLCENLKIPAKMLPNHWRNIADPDVNTSRSIMPQDLYFLIPKTNFQQYSWFDTCQH